MAVRGRLAAATPAAAPDAAVVVVLVTASTPDTAPPARHKTSSRWTLSRSEWNRLFGSSLAAR